MKTLAALVLVTLLGTALGVPTGCGRHAIEPERYACDGDKQRPAGCVCPDYENDLVVLDGAAIALDGAGYVEVTLGDYYVTIDDVLSNGYFYSIWLIAEGNGVAGLQRHDDWCTERLDMTDDEADVYFC